MRICIIRLSAMGDIVNSAFILDHIHTHYPHYTVDWVCESVFATLLESHPAINNVITVNLKQVKRKKSVVLLLQEIKKLRALEKYDLVIDLQGLIKSALVARLLGTKRYGFAKNSIREPFASRFYTHHVTIAYQENSLWRTAHLVNEALNLNIKPQEITHKKPSLHVNTKAPFRAKIVLVVGSSKDEKNYNPTLLAQALNLLAQEAFVIWGNENEHQLAQTLVSKSSYATLAPKMPIEELMALIQQADLVIGNDTGPTHLAWAMNRPSITLFGPTNYKKLMWVTPINSAIHSKSSSINDITPEEIAKEAERLINL